MSQINLKGRVIPLLYTMLEMKQVQEEIAPVGTYLNLLVGRKDAADQNASLYGSREHLDALGKTIRILGNAGLEEAGEEPDLTDRWVLRALKPGALLVAMDACLTAINDGMASEIPNKEQNEPVDVVLESLKKKEAKGN